MSETTDINIDELQTALRERIQQLNIHEKNKELAELEARAAGPDFWNDAKRANDIMQTISHIKKSVSPWIALMTELENTAELLVMAEQENDTAMIEEIHTTISDIADRFYHLDDSMLFTDDDDRLNCFLNIHPGAGGTESCDWAAMLYRMYSRWLERKKFKVTILDYQPGNEAGIKNVTLSVEGEDVFGYLKAEHGVHRLVRISPFDANARRHTSFAAVEAVPQIGDEIELEINENDIRIDTYRATGAGGQHVNTTDSAVRITHLPSNTVVTCQNERSQHQNRAVAMKLLRSKLYEMERQKRKNEIDQKTGEKRSIEWGSQIRSYVFQPYTMVKDLRTQYETSNIKAMMDGELLDDFIIMYLKQFRTLDA